ncbi:36900_t:CDS:2 [Gigaspora margarita]|uniref:36900_t:CDS:1 n=1 Tax=Gigaspora margarita TaxID=4874 RepID=A0ABN7VYS4_GIGMA|nr:36900_t:CDS:2 [Gigaspora margarita]
MAPKKGFVHEEFDEITDSNGNLHYKCKYCSTSYVKNITHMTDHLDNCKNFLSSKNQSSTLQKSLLAQAFYSTGVSFNIIDNLEFRLFLNRACPNFKIPSRFSLSNKMKEARHTAENIAAEIDEVITEIGCWAHNINLWIKDMMKLSWKNEIIENAKSIIQYYCNNKVLLATLKRIQKEKYQKNITLLLTGTTRWRSVYYYDMFWNDLQTLNNLLQPFVKFINSLQSDYYTLSNAYVAFQNINFADHDFDEPDEFNEFNKFNKLDEFDDESSELKQLNKVNEVEKSDEIDDLYELNELVELE